VFGSSGRFFTQINNGAPFHVFLSADQEKPVALKKAGLVVEESRFTYALGKLVLWSFQSNLVDSSGQVLKQNNFRRLAIANPRLAPYGIAAMEVLENLGLASGIQGKIIQGENIAQAYQFVRTGNVELGLVAFSQVHQQDRIGSGSSWIIPASLYNPIRQDAVLLRRGANNQAAIAFLKFIRSEPGRAIIESSGYQVEMR
jgi:molybdate transport system substrate-binding protein